MTQESSNATELRLSSNEQQQAAELAEQLNPFDTVSTLVFGKEALQSITAFSDRVLADVRAKDAGDAGDILHAMVTNMSSSQFDDLGKESFLSRLPLIGELFQSFGKFVKGFDTVKAQLDELAKRLEAQETKLAQDIQQLDGLYDENLGLLQQLDIYIHAGNIRLEKLKNEELVALKEKADASNDALDGQAYRDALQAMTRLEKRVHNLSLARMAAIQTAPADPPVAGRQQDADGRYPGYHSQHLAAVEAPVPDCDLQFREREGAESHPHGERLYQQAVCPKRREAKGTGRADFRKLPARYFGYRIAADG